MRPDDVPIQQPCPAGLGPLGPDERRRFCALCDRHVTNLSAMSEMEARLRVALPTWDGRRCVSYESGADGKIAFRTSRLTRVVGAVAALLTGATGAWASETEDSEEPSSDPPTLRGAEVGDAGSPRSYVNDLEHEVDPDEAIHVCSSTPRRGHYLGGLHARGFPRLVPWVLVAAWNEIRPKSPRGSAAAHVATTNPGHHRVAVRCEGWLLAHRSRLIDGEAVIDDLPEGGTCSAILRGSDRRVTVEFVAGHTHTAIVEPPAGSPPPEAPDAARAPLPPEGPSSQADGPPSSR
ncbi:MAG: hypothetical protein EA397_02280 [Deltaproteobacteria bacterium]|nr:MAG: hypothetical protein EA397_02280 [Deltaproteobacteria bacterium]